jgi:hypothetical protein
VATASPFPKGLPGSMRTGGVCFLLFRLATCAGLRYCFFGRNALHRSHFVEKIKNKTQQKNNAFDQ